MSHKVTFEIEKQTKRTIRYKETGGSLDTEKVIGTLYIQKEALKEMFGGQAPDELVVTIEEGEA